MKLLAEVRSMLGEVKINNADVTIIAQAPKIAPYTEQMTLNISSVLGIPESAVNVKATTEEGLGFTGEPRVDSSTGQNDRFAGRGRLHRHEFPRPPPRALPRIR